MDLPVALAFLGEVFIGHFGTHKMAVHGIAVLCLGANLVYYVLRNIAF